MKTLPSFDTALLVVASATATLIGASLALDPIGFEASAGLELTADPALLSELRAPGGALLLIGLFLGLGALRKVPRPTALLVGALLYLGYALGRAIGVGLDGAASEGLLVAMGIELVIGAGCLAAYLRRPAAVVARS